MTRPLDPESNYEFVEDFPDPDDLEEEFLNTSLLSHIAVKLRDKVLRSTHVKGSIPYHNAFTGKDIVSTIQSVIQRDLPDIASDGRQTALQVARSLKDQLFFYEVEWGDCVLSDGVEDVFMFLDEHEADGGGLPEREELPTGVILPLTKCYASTCGDDDTPCYLYSCPRRARGWADGIDPSVLKALSTSEINRQTVIAKTINQEAQYVKDLDLIDSLFVKPLRRAPEPIIAPEELDSFIDVVFGNILDLRETNRRLLEVMFVRQREQGPFIQWLGDIFLTAAAEFRVVYPLYVGNLPLARNASRTKLKAIHNFGQLELKHFITRPSEHLQRYPVLLEAIRAETSDDNPDAEYLLEASEAIRKLSTVAQLRTFQSSMTRSQSSRQEWHDLVPADMQDAIPKAEKKRQALPDSSGRGVQEFLREIFHNYDEVLSQHRRLLDAMHEVQRDEYPCVTSIVAPIYDAALNWRDVYMEYVSHYPIARYRVDEAMLNPTFRKVVEDAQRHPDARRLDIRSFINRPIPRMLRYDLLLNSILKETPDGHSDKQSIPEVSELIRALGKSLDHCIATAERKVEMWRYNRSLVWKPGEEIDLDLLDETRTLVHTGRLLRQPEGGMDWNSWSELFVLLFDHYLVMTKVKEKYGVARRYHVNRRPIPLELLTLVSFSESPQQRSSSLLGNFRGRNIQHAEGAPNGGGAEPVDSRLLYPCSIHHSGRVGGHYHLFAESAQARAEWERKLNEAVVLRKAVQDANQVFEKRTISTDTFVVPSLQPPMLATYDGTLTGQVTCSIPLKSSDGRPLIAVGCAEGVWIGLRHDARSMRRVLHLKQVTQCAMLEEFGIFLVLADKSLFAYHIEALVPTGPAGENSQPRQPQKLNGSRDVQFFSVGTLHGRTLIVYMKKKGLDSVFRVLEPVTGKVTEKAKTPTFSRNLFGPKQPEWFRVYKEFFLPSDSFDLYFLKAKVAILCSKGFEIMDLTDFKSVTIPFSEDPRHGALMKRCESCKAMGIFRSGENEFFLCYDEFGLYVDRHGEPSRSPGVVEWEGTAERVAFHPPYILIFDTRFIEVRHIDKGNLVQILPGMDLHCTWDGRGYFAAPTPMSPIPGGWDDHSPGEATVHAVMKAEEIPNASTHASPRHVFELAPTQLLYAPPELAVQSPVGFIPHKYSSPPHSPRPASLGSGWAK
ncbi:hypothetical protein BS47DRAFT_1429505 [Hydnum rufescens UP504]|uniref:Uncharacterized protein n=1 Tax=Hydnum rufescens UP504 TaxID=1448309 RepID=A0A9P6B7W0_9AGAM|nr:hypothetical protein BS47DRAFT_1429505 [Hydnum rufescens UP504]